MTRPRLSAIQTIALGFFCIIVIGGILLSLPISNRGGVGIPLINGLFTATSATCVTGLVVYDTFSQFTLFGQIVIILLIQIGGLGFMTFSVLFSLLMRKRIGLRARSVLTEAVGAAHLSGIVRLIRRILLGTLIFELSGAILLSIRFIPTFGPVTGIWYSIFHSISAFCNAGFDLMGRIKPYDSLTYFAGDVIVNFTIMGLIIIGGIGFVVWDDIHDHGFHVKQYNLHTKVMLVSTLCILLIPAAVFMVTEWNGAMAGMPMGKRVLCSLFQSTTTRTAGFNTIDNAALSEAGTMLTMGLMFVGAGPGSTAGGIKITTFVLLMLGVVTFLSNREDTDIYHRRLDQALIRRAFCTAVFYFMMAMGGAFLILLSQEYLPMKDIFFEVFSALGTVGLSTGITRSLGGVSKLVIMFLMYSGRIGSMMVILSMSENKTKKALRNPLGKVIIG